MAHTHTHTGALDISMVLISVLTACTLASGSVGPSISDQSSAAHAGRKFLGLVSVGFLPCVLYCFSRWILVHTGTHPSFKKT